MRGDDLQEVIASPAFASYPDDVRLLAGHLAALQANQPAAMLDCGNAGTVIRFLTAFCAQQEGREIVLTGCERMKQRPIGQLVEILRALGADIAYLGNDGFPPLRIKGSRLRKLTVQLPQPQSTQFVSALLLIGVDVQTASASPYIELTRSVIRDFREGRLSSLEEVERDWSSAAFWLEREALGLAAEQYVFPGLKTDSLQGDKVAVELFARIKDRSLRAWDFSPCPDLYPAAAVACHLLGLHLEFTGLESLRLKESDRLAAIEENLRNLPSLDEGVIPAGEIISRSDHRIAMAFLAAGIPVDDTACISKSYPAFLSQLLRCTRLVALKEGNSQPFFSDGLLTRVQSDEGKGKKQALLKAMPLLDSEYVWLTDADTLPPAVLPASLPDADLIILPLRMVAPPENGIIVQLQILEYSAIQALTMLTAEWGRPVMCAGANMIVRRSAWLECAEDIRADIPSGDDMFILEAMKKRGKKIIAGDYSLAATVSAQPSLRALLRQRMRWAGKAPAYSDSDIICCGLITLLSNLLVIVLPGWLFVKWIADMLLVSRHRKRMNTGNNLTLGDWLLGLLLTIVYPFYMLLCLLGGLLRKKKW